MLKTLFVAFMIAFSTLAVADTFDKLDRKQSDLDYGWQFNTFEKGNALDGCNVAKTFTAHPDITKELGVKEIVLILITSEGSSGYLFNISSAEFNIVDNKEYKVEFMFNAKVGGDIYNLDGVGVIMPDQSLRHVANSVNAAFVEAFAASENIALWINEKPVGLYSLMGSRNAVNTLRQCDAVLNKTDKNNKETF